VAQIDALYDTAKIVAQQVLFHLTEEIVTQHDAETELRKMYFMLLRKWWLRKTYFMLLWK
jgi:hypothetical protein